MYNIRKFVFKIKDLLAGSPVGNNIEDIGNIFNDQRSESTRIKLTDRQNKILEFAIANVEFYRCNVRSDETLSLGSFPVINKNIIRENLQRFIADNRDTANLFKVVTSGSTGTPFAVYQDIGKKQRNTADTIFFGNLSGYDVGSLLVYLKVWTTINKKNKLKSWAENVLPIDVTQLSDSEIQKLIDKVDKSSSQKAFLAYSSALETIVSFLERTTPNYRFKNVRAVIAMSEAINDRTKALIHKYFKVYAVSRYSNVENGIIAQQRANGDRAFELNMASYKIELLELDSDSPVPLGQPGRIVLTDYFNFAMPMIRYDTGDIGVMEWDESIGKSVLTTVEGRKMDMVFNTSGEIVSSFTITNNMWLYPEIKQYQFIQLSKNAYKFKLNLEGAFVREAELRTEFQRHFGSDASIAVEYVNEIPLLNSGKRKKVVNEMKN